MRGITTDDGPPPDCSNCDPSTGPDGNVTWVPRPGDGGGSSGGSGDSGGGSSGGGSSGGGSSGGGSSGSGVDNYEPPPYTEPSANYYPAEQTNPPASDPVTDSNQQQETASQVINDGAIENIKIAAAVVITAGIIAAVAIGSAPLIAAVSVGVAVAVAADTVYQVATTGEVDLTETAIAGAVGGVIGLAVGLVAIAGTAAVVAEGAAAAELETLRDGADIEKGAEVISAAVESVAAEVPIIGEIATQVKSVVIDTNALISAENGGVAVLNNAIAGRNPLVPVQAASEFLVKETGESLQEIMNQIGASLIPNGTAAEVAALQTQVSSIGISLSIGDGRIAAAALREGVPIITNDIRFLKLLNQIGIGGIPY